MGHHPRRPAQWSVARWIHLLAAVTLCGCNLVGPVAPKDASLGPSLYDAVASDDRLPFRPGGSLGSVFSFRSIDGPGASATSATGINLRGQVVGDFSAGATGEAFHWTNGIATRIVIPGAQQAYARGINDNGAIVGGFVDADGAEHGFLLAGGTLRKIDAPGAVVTAAFGINEQGAIVGNFIDGDGVRHGFLLQAGRFSIIEGPGSQWTQAFGINARGQVVGFYLGPDLRGHGFLWSEGSLTTIDAPGAVTNTATYGINSRGQIVGFYDTGSGGRHGFLLEQGAWIGIRLPRAVETSPIGINDAGQVTGEYLDSRGRVHGFLTGRPGRLPNLMPPAAGVEDSMEDQGDVSSLGRRALPRDLEAAAASLGVGAVRSLGRGSNSLSGIRSAGFLVR